MKLKFWDQLVISKKQHVASYNKFCLSFVKKIYLIFCSLPSENISFLLLSSVKKYSCWLALFLKKKKKKKKKTILPSTPIKKVYLLPIPSIFVVNTPQ